MVSRIKGDKNEDKRKIIAVQTGTAETDDVQGRIAGEFAGYRK